MYYFNMHTYESEVSIIVFVVLNPRADLIVRLLDTCRMKLLAFLTRPYRVISMVHCKKKTQQAS